MIIRKLKYEFSEKNLNCHHQLKTDKIQTHTKCISARRITQTNRIKFVYIDNYSFIKRLASSARDLTSGETSRRNSSTRSEYTSRIFSIKST